MKKRKKALLLFLTLLLIIPLLLPINSDAATKISKSKMTMYVGDTETLKISGTEKGVKWTSSKKSIATVNSSGKVVAKKDGIAIIYASTNEGKYKCVVTVKKAKSLIHYVKDYNDGNTYHLLYDVALNKKATTNMDDGVTYTFNTDDSGKRILGGVMAYYTASDSMKKIKKEKFYDSFVKEYFPELSELKTSSIEAAGYYIKTINFSDYYITFIPDDKGMTVILDNR